MKNRKTMNNPTVIPISCGILTPWVLPQWRIRDKAANDNSVVLHKVDAFNKKSTLVTTFIKSIKTEFISFKNALKAANDHYITFQRVIKEGYDPHLFDVDEVDHEEGDAN